MKTWISVPLLCVFFLFLAGCSGTDSSEGPGKPVDTMIPFPTRLSDPVENPPTEPLPDPTQAIAPEKPQPTGSGISADAGMLRGEVFIDGVDLLIRESFPIQLAVIIKGNLPTPCHKLRVDVSRPDEQNRIAVLVFTVVNPDEICIQVLSPFEEQVQLTNLTEGTYSVWVNGSRVGEFKYP